MKDIFIDTNIWLRFFLKDNKQHYNQVFNLFTKIEEGVFRPYISSIVLLEINYVLRSYYKLSLIKTMEYLDAIVSTRNITVLEKSDYRKALNLYSKYKIKFADCLILSQLHKEMILLSYDREFEKIPGIKLLTPFKLFSQVSN